MKSRRVLTHSPNPYTLPQYLRQQGPFSSQKLVKNLAEETFKARAHTEFYY